VSDREPSPDDTSGTSPLVRAGLGGLALVVVVALAFWGIGSLRDEAGTPVVTDDPDVAAPDDDGEGVDDDADDADADDADADAPDADDADTADAPDEGADDADTDDAPNDAGEDDAAEDGAAEVDRAVPPGEVTIQVLDGAKEDGGTAADDVATLLGDAGYRITARNDALTYEVTTVLYNPGNEEAAAQVAAELGGAEVREQPGNLSTAVDLHVVVGRDRL
jgi:hypothetical protein